MKEIMSLKARQDFQEKKQSSTRSDDQDWGQTQKINTQDQHRDWVSTTRIYGAKKAIKNMCQLYLSDQS